MICLLPATLLPGTFFFSVLETIPHFSSFPKGVPRFAPPVWLLLWTRVEDLNVFGNLDIGSKWTCRGPVWPWWARDGEGMISEAFFRPGAPCRAGLPDKVSCWIAWGYVSKRTFAENILPKTKIMDGLPFLSLFSPCFLLSAWEPLQRVRCVGVRRQAVIVKGTWKYNWKQTLLRKADLGELLLWGSGGFQVFPLFGADSLNTCSVRWIICEFCIWEL